MPYVPISVNYAAKSNFAADTATILLVNQFDLSRVKTASQERLHTLKNAGYTSLKFAGNQLKQLPHVRVINLAGSPDLYISTDSIKSLASKYGATHVLALKNLAADIILSDVKSSSTYFNTYIIVDFILYEGNGLYHKKLKGTASDLIPANNYVSGVYAAREHPPVEQFMTAVDSSAHNATLNALQDYLPYAISHNRPLYEDYYLDDATRKIYKGDLDGAIKSLEPGLKKKDVKKVAKVAYNLAVVYEAKGDIDKASAMARLSLDKNNNQYASSMLNDLKDE